jgi:MarR family transcriptional regulator for hemolysin
MLPVGREDIGHLISQAGRLLHRQLDGRLKEMGIAQSAYMVLRAVEDEESPSTVDAIAAGLTLDRSSVSRTVSRMLADGWLEERRGPDDSAGRILETSSKAKVIMPAVVASGHWTIEEGLNGFTNEEIEQLKAYLRRLVGNLEQLNP